MTRRITATALTAAALLAMPAMANAQSPSPSTAPAPYNIPTATQGVSLPLVAALTMPRGQTLGQVLRKGLQIRLIAYKPIYLSVAASLAPATAKRFHTRARGAIPLRSYQFGEPGVYTLRLRLAHRVVRRLHDAMRAKFRLRTTLRGETGSTTSTSPLLLKR